MLIGVGAVLAAAVLLFATRSRKEKEKKEKEEEPLKVEPEVEPQWPLRAERSIKSEEVKRAQDELRLLDLEREFLSYAIRRLYEAAAEGKISEEERDRLAGTYKERLTTVKDTISRNGSILALHELEGMQEDLVKLFSERFDEVNTKIEELRSRLEIKPAVEAREVPVEAPTPEPTLPTAAPPTEKKKVERRPPTPRKTEAEERIEKIRAEVEKVLERLGQIETEA